MASYEEDDAGEEVVAPKDLDDKSLKAFHSFFRTLSDDGQVVRFFDRKGYYTVHGEMALHVARQFYRTTAVVKGTDTGLPYVNVNRMMYESVLRELLLNNTAYVVELYEQVGTAWKLARSASPGKLGAFDDELYRSGTEMAEVPLVAALSFGSVDGQVVVGVAYADPSACRLGAAELIADEQLSGLEAVLVQLGAREAVVNKDAVGLLDASQRTRLDALLSGVGLMATHKPASLFAPKHLEADLAKVIKGGSVEQHRDVLERRVACAALAAVMAYAELMAEGGSSSGGGGGRYSLSLYNPGCFMRLDATAQRALNVFPSRQDANTTFSLYGLLNRCRSAMGKRRLKTWLKQPLVDLEAIGARHDVVEAFVDDAELRQRLRDQHFRGLPDVERLTRKLQARRINLPELHQLYRTSARLPLIEEAFRCHEGPHAQRLVASYAEPLSAAHAPDALQRFEELLEAALDLDRLPDEYLISPTYDARLGELAEVKRRIEDEIEALAQRAASDLSLELGKSIKLCDHRAANTKTRCLRITAKEEKNVRAKLQAKYQVIETRKDGTKFSNRELRQAAEQLQAASAQYHELQAELVQQVMEVALTFSEVWEGVAALLADLDVLLAFAEAACCAPTPYVRPVMLGPDAGELALRQCRHPCVELQDNMNFIANDCVMVRGSSWFQIITGPNMGGKSTFIRQVGVSVLLAQVGAFVPCSEARIAVRDSIFCRVGAGDCQLRGVSTFMAEMLETAAILRGASSHSLVIIDELGRGTSTYDGFGLAWAISEHLAGPALGAPTLFATHFHELTELRAAVGVKNMQAAAHLDPVSHKLTMLYAIKEGACDQSFGVHVAASAGFPPDVIRMANERLKQLEAGEDRVREVAAKRRRTEAPAAGQHQEAEAAARDFLRQFAELPINTMAPQEAVAAVDNLLQLLPPGVLAAAGGP